MSFPGNTGFQLGGGGDAPKQAAPALGLPIAKPTFGAAAGTGSAVGFGGFGSPSAGAPTAFSTPAISAAPSTGFSFGASAAPAAPAPSFGATPASQGSFNFGSSLSLGSTAVTAPAASSGFGLGSLSSAVTPNTSAFSLGAAPALSTAAPAAATPAPAMSAPVLGFGPPSTSSVPTASSFSFGASATTPAPTGFSLGGATSTTSVSTGFSLSTSVPTTSATGFSLGVGTSVPSAATTSTAPTTTSAVSFSFPTSSSTTTSGFGLNTTSAPNLTFNLGGIANSTATVSGTTTTTTDATQSIPVTSLNFIQLEETINKWTMDLEEQEKLFLLQATQVNAWDRTLTSNSEKIEALNRAVEAVKLEQQRLDNELEFICSQQRELEDCLIPLEKELAGNAVTDPEREHTYDLAASMDTQLKQMSEDLKEIIENLNERNRAQDSSDPLVQIGRILNSHMDSLQWIENNTHAIQNHLDHVSKLHESHRRDNERSFHLTYD